MPKTKMKLLEPGREKWNKYFVNGIECEHDEIFDAIHQIILDNQLYNGTLTLEKKSYLEELCAGQILEQSSDGHFTSQTTYRNYSSDDKRSFLSLDTKQFASKYNPRSEEYQLLIKKMLQTLETLCLASLDYKEHSANLETSSRNLMTYHFEHLDNPNDPYGKIINDFTIEQSVNTLCLCALSLYIARISDIEAPSPQLNTSSIKESWSDDWTNKKKSQYLKTYFSLLLNQTESLGKLWMLDIVGGDKSVAEIVKSRFDAMKNAVVTFQNKKIALDTSMPEVRSQTFASRMSSFFGRGNHSTTDNQVDIKKITATRGEEELDPLTTAPPKEDSSANFFHPQSDNADTSASTSHRRRRRHRKEAEVEDRCDTPRNKV